MSELDDAALERAGQMRRRVHELAPELLPKISDLVKAGLIEGWRNVRCNAGPAGDVPGVTADVYLSNSKWSGESHGTTAQPVE